MSDNRKPDFRDAAVVASESLLSAAPRGIKPADSGFSLCLRLSDDEAWNGRSAAVVQTALSFLWIPGLAGGGLLLSRYGPTDQPLAFALALVLIVGSFVTLALLLMGKFAKDGGLRERIAGRRGSFIAPDELPAAISAELEDGNTYNVPKIMPEDLVVLRAEPDAQRILMEGASHRYVIYRDDVTSVQWGRPTLIAYRVGEVELKLALVPGQLGAQVLGNFGLGGDDVGRVIRGALGGA